MGQFFSAKSSVRKKSDGDPKCSSPSKNKILRKNKTSKTNTTQTSSENNSTQPSPEYIATNKMPPILPGQIIYEREDEDMEGLQLEPEPHSRQGRSRRRPTLVEEPRHRDDIMIQNVHDDTSYSLKSNSVEEQARLEENFIGNAHYYILPEKKVSTTSCEDDSKLTCTCRLAMRSMVHM